MGYENWSVQWPGLGIMYVNLLSHLVQVSFLVKEADQW